MDVTVFFFISILAQGTKAATGCQKYWYSNPPSSIEANLN
jgi:hypothetical protein